MGKIYMAELADLLAQKTGVSKTDAQQFLTAFVETIQQGVNSDKLVKIKGLGTFKVIDVEARESVNVNTGERVMIEGHQKLTFTPDASMKELVNKPFSQFETVVLNEGVEFEEEIGVAEPSVADDSSVADDPSVADDSSAVEKPTVTEEPTVVEEEVHMPAPVAEKKKDEMPVPAVEDVAEEKAAPVAEKAVEKKVEKEPVVVEDEKENEEKSSSYWWLWLLLAIVACVISFAGGYLTGRHIDHQQEEGEETPDTAVKVAPVVVVKDTIVTDIILKDTLKKDTLQPKSIVEEKTAKPEAKESEAEPEWKKYEKMDVRVRTGAYGIVGTDRMEKVRPGDTTKRIAKRTLGEGMECYIEVYNNITNADLKEGQSIKIPKLEWKKNLRKQNK